ncbi:MAG: T9SS type A sorting domain-containing protein [Bacteroidota bacterium]
MRKLFLLLIFSLVYLSNCYNQIDISCLGIDNVKDTPAGIKQLDDGNFLVLFNTISNFYLSKLTIDGEELWRRTFEQTNIISELSIETIGDKIIITGKETPPDDFKYYPFFLLLSDEGNVINHFEFPNSLSYHPISLNIEVVDNEAYFNLLDRIVKVSEEGTIDTVYQHDNDKIMGLKKLDNSEWLIYKWGPGNDLLRLDANFEVISDAHISGTAGSGVFGVGGVYFDSQNRLHVLGTQYDGPEAPPIWFTDAYDEHGNLLWSKSLSFDQMTCVFIGDIQEYNDGYVLFGINRLDQAPEYTYVPVVYFLNQEGELVWYYLLEELEHLSTYFKLEIDFTARLVVKSESNSLFLAGFNPCGNISGSSSTIYNTYVYNLTIEEEDIVTTVPKVEETSVHIYPTVFDQMITINSPNIIERVTIYDINGKLIQYADGIRSNQFQLSIDQPGQQMYIITVIHSDGERVLKRVIKN